METQSRILKRPAGLRLQVQTWTLFVEAGPDRGREFSLGTTPATCGRSPDATFRLTDTSVSREHVRFVPDGDSFRVSDLGSKSGTLVNGVEIEAARIRHGARIGLGDTSLVLRSGAQEIVVPKAASPEFEGLLGASESMLQLFGMVEKVAPLDLPVLLCGETGTGKEGLAAAIHRRSERPDSPYVIVDCTQLSDPTQARSELFGHQRGAFTGADKARSGAFLQADGGTLFLDEIGELPPEIQAQLLRVLQEGRVQPLGSDEAREVRVRLVCATHRDLPQQVEAGSFRQDLFYRIAGVVLEVPPLRERLGDLALLAKRWTGPDLRLSEAAIASLQAHPWPGNVRELQFVLKRASALAGDGEIEAEDLGLVPAGVNLPPETPVEEDPLAPASPEDFLPRSPQRLAQRDEAEIRWALRETAGNRVEAAKLLGISRATLYRRLKALEEV